MIAFAPKPKPEPEKPRKPSCEPFVDIPFEPVKGSTQMDGFFRHVQFVLHMQGFELGKSGNEYVLKRGDEVMIMAPDMHDMLMLLCVTGAWANVNKGDK